MHKSIFGIDKTYYHPKIGFMKKVIAILKRTGAVLGATILMLVLISGITAFASMVMNNTETHKHIVNTSAETISEEWFAIDLGLKN